MTIAAVARDSHNTSCCFFVIASPRTCSRDGLRGSIPRSSQAGNTSLAMIISRLLYTIVNKHPFHRVIIITAGPATLLTGHYIRNGARIKDGFAITRQGSLQTRDLHDQYKMHSIARGGTVSRYHRGRPRSSCP